MNALQQIATPHRVKLTVDDYLLLDREGALAPYGRTELVDGVILAVSSQFRPHSYAKAELAYRCAERWKRRVRRCTSARRRPWRCPRITCHSRTSS